MVSLNCAAASSYPKSASCHHPTAQTHALLLPYTLKSPFCQQLNRVVFAYPVCTEEPISSTYSVTYIASYHHPPHWYCTSSSRVARTSLFRCSWYALSLGQRLLAWFAFDPLAIVQAFWGPFLLFWWYRGVLNGAAAGICCAAVATSFLWCVLCVYPTSYTSIRYVVCRFFKN